MANKYKLEVRKNPRKAGPHSVWSDDVGVIIYRDHAFQIEWSKDSNESILANGGLSVTILCHCTEIVAKGNKLVCWECGGKGKKFSPPELVHETGQPASFWNCPTCHGEGQHEIVWKE